MAELHYLEWDIEGNRYAQDVFHKLHVQPDQALDEVATSFDDLYRRVGETTRSYRPVTGELEELYRDLQAGHFDYTDPVLHQEEERSMSMGDIVEFTDTDEFHMVEQIGFTEIDPEY